jgi:hypothetical protein
MEMLAGYASGHQHPFNGAIRMIGTLATILGAFIALSWINSESTSHSINFAYVVVGVLFAFYFTLDKSFRLVFLLYAVPVTYLVTRIGTEQLPTSAFVAAATFLGGYARSSITRSRRPQVLYCNIRSRRTWRHGQTT